MLLAKDRIASLPIILSEAQLSDSNSSALYAAKELRYYLGRMTAASFEIKAGTADECGILVGEVTGLDVSALGEDGLKILSRNGSILIAGGKRGVLYGAYEFLETLGCRFFTHNCELIPTETELFASDDYNVEQKPILEYRHHNYSDIVQNPRFAAKCRINAVSTGKTPTSQKLGGGVGYVPGWFVHTFEKMIPVSVYGETHPEYFAMVDGKRVIRTDGRTQLCLTNPDVLKICTESVRAALKAHPEARIISISQNDWKRDYCHCEECSRIDAEEGSSAGTMLRFVNSIAEALEDEFPDVIFDTLAYHYTRPSPKYVRNRKNVCVRLCSIEACFAHSFDSCDDESRGVLRPDGSKVSFIDDLRAWGKKCDRIYIWDYTTCFAHYPTPHPNWRVLQPNLQAMVENNVKGVFEQANGASRGGVDFNELRAYLIAKLLWDPYCDLEKHKREFMEYYYGDAAPALTEYLDLLCDTVEKENIHVGFNDNPTKDFLREELLDIYDGLFDKAAEAVKGDALRLWRVEKNRLSVRWVRLKRAAMLRGEYDAEEINRFFTDWRAFNLSRIDEWFNLENTHRALLDGHWRAIKYFDHWNGEEPEIL